MDLRGRNEHGGEELYEREIGGESKDIWLVFDRGVETEDLNRDFSM